MAMQAPTELWGKLQMELSLSWKLATSSCSDATLRQSMLLLDLPRRDLRVLRRFRLRLADLFPVLATQALRFRLRLADLLPVLATQVVPACMVQDVV